MHTELIPGDFQAKIQIVLIYHKIVLIYHQTNPVLAGYSVVYGSFSGTIPSHWLGVLWEMYLNPVFTKPPGVSNLANRPLNDMFKQVSAKSFNSLLPCPCPLCL